MLGVADITQMAKVYAAGSFRFFETYSIVADHLVKRIGLSLLLRQLERRMREAQPALIKRQTRAGGHRAWRRDGIGMSFLIVLTSGPPCVQGVGRPLWFCDAGGRTSGKWKRGASRSGHQRSIADANLADVDIAPIVVALDLLDEAIIVIIAGGDDDHAPMMALPAVVTMYFQPASAVAAIETVATRAARLR